MNFKILILLLIIILTLFISCEEINDPKPDGTLPLVVEGWIEDGESPLVIVTRALDLTIDIDSIGDITEKWGRVTIYDNENPYILTGRLNKNYTPAFVFTSTRLKGKVGHTYRLVIESENETVEAISSMPSSPSIQSLQAIKVEDSDSLYYINARIKDIDKEGFYKFFAQSYNRETRFYPTFLGTFSGEDYNENEGFDINRGIHSGYSDEESGHYYVSGDIVTVKLCRLESGIFDFWKAYDQSVALSQNLFFTFDQSCPTNIVGGKGYFAAYGISTHVIRIP